MGYHTIRVDTTMGPRPPVPLLHSGRHESRYRNVVTVRTVGEHRAMRAFHGREREVMLTESKLREAATGIPANPIARWHRAHREGAVCLSKYIIL
jgi:hypothetical protein